MGPGFTMHCVRRGRGDNLARKAIGKKRGIGRDVCNEIVKLMRRVWKYSRSGEGLDWSRWR